jgi:transcriptional regulator with XRE-family HTH domain
MNLSYINKSLRFLRKVNDIEVSELAKKLEVSSSFVTKIEHGDKKVNLKLLEKYSKIFDMPKSFIVYLAEKMEENKAMEGTFLDSIVLFAETLKSWDTLTKST